jgi:hypothetical protein
MVLKIPAINRPVKPRCCPNVSITNKGYNYTHIVGLEFEELLIVFDYHSLQFQMLFSLHQHQSILIIS